METVFADAWQEVCEGRDSNVAIANVTWEDDVFGWFGSILVVHTSPSWCPKTRHKGPANVSNTGENASGQITLLVPL